MTRADDIHRVGEKLARVRRARPPAFGAETHGFQSLPPVPLVAVDAFEARHGVSLPADYRDFVLNVSAGGAGPAYGLVPFDKTLSSWRDVPEGVVSRPFPFTEAYNPHDDPALREYWARDGRGEVGDDEDERRVAAEVAGTLVLCHEGCGYLHLLVVNGPAHGQMWIDGTVSDYGYAPLGVGFLDWYERWLDSILGGGDGSWWVTGPST